MRKLGVFLLLSFGFSWSIGLFLWLLKAGPLGVLGLSILYMWGPALGAVAAQKLSGESISGPLGLRFNFNPWWLLGIGLPLLFSLLVIPLALPLPGVRFNPEAYLKFIPQWQAQTLKSLPIHLFWLSLVNGLIAGPTFNALVALGEELGWRGFLYKEFEKFGFWRSAFLIGAIWGFWHAPLELLGHNYPEAPAAGVLLMVLWCLLLAPLFSFVRLKSGSVVAAAVAHGTLNALAGLPLLVLEGPPLLYKSTGLAGFLALGVLNLGLYLTNKRFQQGIKLV